MGFPTPSSEPQEPQLKEPEQLTSSTGSPLHAQLAAIIRKRIDAGDLQPGEGIPSESDLMQRFGISRGTVRRAIRTLVEEGYLTTRKGSGTYVAEGGLARPGMRRPLSFAALLSGRGVSFSTKVLCKEVVSAPASVSAHLGLRAGSEVMFMRRVRSVGGTAVVCQESWENLDACPGLESSDFERESLFDAVERCSGRAITSSTAHYSATKAGTEHGGFLSCEPNDAVLVLEQVISLDNGTPIEWSLTWLRPGEVVAGMSLQDQILPGALDAAYAASTPPTAQELELRRDLERLALDVRRGVVETAHRYEGNAFHIGGSCSMAEIVAVLFGHIMRTGRDGTPWEARDRFVLSKAHASIALYPAMLQAGIISQEDLDRGLYGEDAVLFKHPKRDPERGIEMSGGSLGMGLGYAVGLALSLKRRGLPSRVFCVVGDGECDEGSIWESAALAGFKQLDNLTVIVDANGLQLDGACNDILDNGPVQNKFGAFGFDTIEVAGHDVIALSRALASCHTRPCAVVARTVKGRGLSFAENVPAWHDHALDEQLYEQALAELDQAREAMSQ